MSKRLSRIIGFVMLAAGVVFVMYALNHPEASFPWSNKITYVFYDIYLIAMVIFFIAPFKKK